MSAAIDRAAVVVPGPNMTELNKDIKEKKMAKVVKEGGKRGVEIEGVKDMGGNDFFCTKVIEPQGKLNLVLESMIAMNKVCPAGEEERKGCSGHVGKMIFSISDDESILSLVTYVPTHLSEACNALEWTQEILKGCECPAELAKPCFEAPSANWACAELVKDLDTGVVPLKAKDTVITHALNFLRKRELFIDGDSDSEEMVFGDDDFGYDF